MSLVPILLALLPVTALIAFGSVMLLLMPALLVIAIVAPDLLGSLTLLSAAVGAGLGFGAQNIVKDVLNGIFLVAEDQIVADVMTDKATVELTSPVAGVVTALHGEPGQMMAVRGPLAEFEVEGLATVIPFHRHIVSNPAFIGDGEKFDVYTKWIETDWENPIEPYTGGEPIEDDEAAPRQNVVVEVGGRRVEVSLPGDLALGGGGGSANGVVRKKPKARSRKKGGGAAVSGDAVAAPMQGTVVKVAVEEGQEVAAGDLVVVLEAMKMENPVTAHKDGVVTGLTIEAGAAVTQGTVLLELK